MRGPDLHDGEVTARKDWHPPWQFAGDFCFLWPFSGKSDTK
nr:MAG TPA: hypothetical protein [Caudoviricetes sp.]